MTTQCTSAFGTWIWGQLQHLSRNSKSEKEPSLSRFSRRVVSAIVACGFLLAIAGAPCAHAQDMSTGSLNVTVLDPSGAAVNGAQLVLKDLGTNDTHEAKTAGTGGVVLPFLNPAKYSLTVTMTGFTVQVYPEVTIQSNQVTNIKVTMQVGAATQSVSVSGEATPILDTTGNTLSTTIDMKQIQDLPVSGRDAFPLAFLVPGAVGNNFNNYPGGAVDVNTNGFSTLSNRFKSGGFDTNGPNTTNRLENTQEMTVESGELDASKGGTTAMDIGFVTRRGTNRFHGMLFWDYRSDAMNANTWYNNFVQQARGPLIINDFGGNVGGPIWRNKLFFFASLANYRNPQSFTVVTPVGNAATLAGLYTVTPGQTVNVLQAGASAGCPTCTATINPIIAADLQNIESTYTLPGVTISTLDLNRNNVNFRNKSSYTDKYPSLRLDYNITQNLRWTGSVNESNFYNINQGGPPFPGPLYANQAYSNVERNYQVVTGFDWTIRPSLVNAFRVGYLYDDFTYNSQGINSPTDEMVQQGQLQFGFGLNSGVNGFASLKGGSLYPVLSVKNDSTWAHGRHTVIFGVQSATEIDHYYNNQFVPYIGVNGISAGDPVTNALADVLPGDAPASAVGDVQGLYATLNGRMTYYSLGQFVNSKTKQFQPGISFNLHERLNQTALFVQDSWKALPTLTFNLGLRWDFTGASKDETGFYTHPDVPNFWGPTPVGAVFQPGNVGGIQNPVEGPAAFAYAATYVHPQPNIGVAWNPRQPSDTVLGKIFGDGKSVLRVSYTFKNYTEGAQNFWNFGSNNGANFNTYFVANPVAPSGGTPAAGFYDAGSQILGAALPALASTSPSPFQPVIPMSYQAFTGTSYLTFDPHIKQPWVSSWQVGIQRQLTPSNVIEVRYVGNVSRKQWLGINYNETNIFENGFLADFKNAQANLAASGGATFQGSQPTPIFDEAFASSGAAANYTNRQFRTWLEQGQAGAFAGALSGNSTYLCSMISSFSGCDQVGVPATGSYPINFFQANPFAAGAGVGIIQMQNAGYSNYNALQVDFRQQTNHGMQFDANYTLGHSLTNNVQGSLTPGYYGGGGYSGSGVGGTVGGGRGNAAPGLYTIRNPRLNYFPSSFDVRHVLHLSGTYDLPFGHGRPYFNQNHIANAIIGGWTIGTILSYQSGEPYLFTGGTNTFNTNDGGITLNNVTVRQLQKQVGIRSSNGGAWKNLLPSQYYSSTGQANTQYISPNFNAGTIGNLMWLHAPKWINTDLSLNKIVPIYKEYNIKLEGVFLNAFNHPAWTGFDSAAQSNTFATTNGTANLPRNVEVRANFQF